MKSRRVLFFYQHFWPDSPPYASMLRSIGKRLVSDNKAVGVLTAQPSYKESDFDRSSEGVESLDGIDVRRLALLPGTKKIRLIALLGKILFPFRAFIGIILLKFKGRAPTIVVAATIPPVINGFFGLMAARLVGAKFVYHLQDIYPEIGAVGALWSRDSFRYRLLAWVDSGLTRKADACVVLSVDMKRALLNRGVSEHSIYIINNFMLESFPAQSDKVLPSVAKPLDFPVQANAPLIGGNAACFKLVFAGNLGRFQALDSVLQAFLDPVVKELPLELHFLGTGAMLHDLKTMAKNENSVFFHVHESFGRASQLISQCDVGIVSISKGVINYAYPSKTLTYLGLGIPLFALVESDSQMAVDIVSQDLGVVCGDANHRTLVDGYLRLASWLSEELHQKKYNSVRIQTCTEEFSSPDAAAGKWQRVLAELEAT